MLITILKKTTNRLNQLISKVEYSQYTYIKNEPDYRHLKDKDLFEKLYNEVGAVEANQDLKWREEWMHHFHPEPNTSIIDLGAHNGPNLLHYARLGHMVTGVDISGTLIATFEKHKQQEPPAVRKRMTMIKSWIEDYKPDQKFDYVLVTEVLEHVVDPVKILQKAAQCVKKSGIVYISSPATHWGNNTHVRGVPAADLEKWLFKAHLHPLIVFEENNRSFALAKLPTI